MKKVILILLALTTNVLFGYNDWMKNWTDKAIKVRFNYLSCDDVEHILGPGMEIEVGRLGCIVSGIKAEGPFKNSPVEITGNHANVTAIFYDYDKSGYLKYALR